MQKLKVELEIAEAALLLTILDKGHFSGIEIAKQILALVDKIQNPVNADELGKDVLEGLKFPTKEMVKE